MELQDKHRDKAQQLFNDFYNDKITDSKLLIELDKVEAEVKESYDDPTEYNGKKGIWFKFFANDTGAISPGEIYDGLRPATESSKNIAYLMECIGIAVEENSLRMFYS